MKIPSWDTWCSTVYSEEMNWLYFEGQGGEGAQILDLGFQILDFGAHILDFYAQILDLGAHI